VDHEFLERNFGDEGATGVLWKYSTEKAFPRSPSSFGAS